MTTGRHQPTHQLALFVASPGNDAATPATAVPAIADARPTRVGSASISYVDSKTVLSPAAGFMSAYKFTLNPYSGCSFACEYCYARFFAPSLEDQQSWGQWVRVKENALDLIRKAKDPGRTRSDTHRLLPGDAIYMSSVTDPYQPVEQKLGLTRAILQELLEVQPRLTIQTRSPICTRDIDLFKQFLHIRVNFTITTDSEEMRLRYEPHTPAIENRLKAAEAVSRAGVPIGISISPMLPIADPDAFAQRIAAMNASEYVTQFFKPTRSRYNAGSTPEAIQKMQEDGWTKERYCVARDAIANALGTLHDLLEGSAGYQPVVSI